MHRRSLTLFFLLAALGVVLPQSFYAPLGWGIDPSWQIALHLAIERGFVFGKDFVFTYGPLGFVATRLPFESTKLGLLAADILFYTNVAVTMILISRRSPSVLTAFGVFCGACLAAAAPNAGQSLFLNLVFISIYLNEAIRQRNSCFAKVAVGAASCLAVLTFFSSISWGLPAMALLFLAMLGFGLRRAWTAVTVIVLCCSALIFVIVQLCPIDLFGYFQGGLSLAHSYSEVMMLPAERGTTTLPYANTFLFVAAVFVLLSLPQACNRIETLFCFVSGLLILFVLFKHSYVRELSHAEHFWSLVPFPFLVLFMGTSNRLGAAFGALGWLAVVAGLSFGPGFERLLILREKPKDLARYATEFWHVPPLVAQPANLPKISPAILAEIGQSSVDIFPSEVSLVYYYGLNYQPRPVIQSYAAYNNFLDGLNRAKYESSFAPQFVLMHIQPIDNRSPMFDEPATMLALLQRYEVAQVADPFLLLKRRIAPRTMDPQVIAEGHMPLGQVVKLPEREGIIFFRVGVDYSSFGILRKIFFRAAVLKITLRLSTGRRKTYRLIQPLSGDSLAVISPHITGINDLAALLLDSATQLPRVTSFVVHSGSPNSFAAEMNYAFAAQ